MPLTRKSGSFGTAWATAVCRYAPPDDCSPRAEGAAMEADLLPEGLFVSPALLARMAEEDPPPPPPYAAMALLPGQHGHLDYTGERCGRGSFQVGCPPLLMLGRPQEHYEHAALKVPKLEQTTTNSDLPLTTMETPSDPDHITWTLLPSGSGCLPQPLSLHSHVPATLPLPSTSIIARPTPRQLVPPNSLSRGRRRGIGERMRLLAKLMPWDRKLTISALLEEARNYVKFLEAQVSALQCMPVESRFGCPPLSSYAAAAPVLHGLEKLNRQQLLHVLVRSPLVQDKLCALGLCVFGTEQAVLMRQLAAERVMVLHHHHLQREQQQMVLDGGSTSTLSD